VFGVETAKLRAQFSTECRLRDEGFQEKGLTFLNGGEMIGLAYDHWIRLHSAETGEERYLEDTTQPVKHFAGHPLFPLYAYAAGRDITVQRYSPPGDWKAASSAGTDASPFPSRGGISPFVRALRVAESFISANERFFCPVSPRPDSEESA
jgi:hypothetical protein